MKGGKHMAFTAFKPTVTINSFINGVEHEIPVENLSIDEIQILVNNTFNISATLEASSTTWLDYVDDAPLTYTLTIINNEAYAFTGPVEIEIDGLTASVVEYVEGSASANTTNVVYAGDALTFEIAEVAAAVDSIPGEVIVTFNVKKPTVA
jgi:hypothetical protein